MREHWRCLSFAVGSGADILKGSDANDTEWLTAHVRFGSKADMTLLNFDVRFSNRPVRVKRFQTVHDCGVDVARGLVLLSGIGT